jgi:LuxR family maltose regulon positive regulatory protein
MTDLSTGWQALARGSWGEALEHFHADENAPEALEGIGIAQWWLDDADATLAARERAYRLYRASGDPIGAARVASALAWDSVLFGGRTAVARGWLERAARLLADEPTCSEHAWLAVREAEVALNAGAPEVARVAAQRAISLGEELGTEDVQFVGRSLEGVALVQQGAVAEGMRRLDESAAAATAGEIDDLMWTSKVCCNLISACESVGDVERATQWCHEMKEFAQRWELRTLFNVCRTQYAAVLLQQGTWNEAEEELTAAIGVLRSGRRAALVEGTARLGELRRRQGRLDEARSLFGQSELHSVARMGAIELALDEDDAAAALALAERLERATDANRCLARVDVLLLLARAAVAAGRMDVAAAAVEELERVAGVVGTNGARAASAWAAGILALAGGDMETASRRLEDAVDLYGLALAPYERAHARLALSRALRALGTTDRARVEADRAHAAFQKLNARRDAAEAAEVLRLLEPATRPAGPLTKRELEVIALVADGRSNREIAERLVVSEHTVHRHVANILRKLGEPTRAAAAARATRDGLV